MVSQKYGKRHYTRMNQPNENNQPKMLLLEAPKTKNDTTIEAPNDRKYGENTGRDPITGQFSSGNSGKPLGTRHFSTMFRDTIRKIGGVTKDGKQVNFDELIVKKIVMMAVDGNLKAATMIIDRVDGKVPLSFEVNKTERIGVVVLTQKEIEEHEGMFKRHDKSRTNNNTSTSDNRGSQDSSGVTEGGAYESR